MDNRQMLELAAEAMGFVCNRTITTDFPTLWGCFDTDAYQNLRPWNPLTDPADTAEMCAALEINADWWLSNVKCDSRFGINDRAIQELHDSTTQGKLAAWMRAATRAAAEVALAKRKG